MYTGKDDIRKFETVIMMYTQGRADEEGFDKRHTITFDLVKCLKIILINIINVMS